jgi:hypothetical protein
MENNGKGWNKGWGPSYSASKVLLNCYLRYVLLNLLKSQQSAYSLSPGWSKYFFIDKKVQN